MFFSMPYSYSTLFIIIPFVFLGGIVDAVAGGGGLITLPAYLIAGLSPHHAIATNKLSSSIGTVVSTGRMIKNRCIDWGAAIPSAALAILGSLAGANLVLSIDEKIVRYVLLASLPLAAFFVLRKRNLDDAISEPVDRRRQLVIVLFISLLIGVYDGFYGPGTGTFLLLAYTQLGSMRLRIASGNVKFVNLSSNLGSLVVFLLHGQAILPLGLIAGVFGIAGHYIGAGILLKRGTQAVRPIILAVLGLLFCRVLFDLFTAA